MPTIFYQIFNHQIKITSKTLKQLEIEIEALFNELKHKKDFENIKILRNKLIHLLDEKDTSNLDKKIKKAYNSIKKILGIIEEYIEDNEEEKIELIDVVKKIEKNIEIVIKLNQKKEIYIKLLVQK